MQEQFATFDQNLYPEHKGGKNMAMQDETAQRIAESEEGERTPRPRIETRKQRGADRERGAEGRDQKRQRAEERALKPLKKQEKVPLIDAKPIIRIVAALRDERKAIVSSEREASSDEDNVRLLISPEEVESIQELLIDYGRLDPRRVIKASEISKNKRRVAELIVEAHELIKQVGVDKSQKEAWQYHGGPGRVLEEEMVEKALSRDEEVLTIGKVESLLEIEKFGEAAEGGGPGAMGPVAGQGNPNTINYYRGRLDRIKEVYGDRRSGDFMGRLWTLDDVLAGAIDRGELADEDPQLIADLQTEIRTEIDATNREMVRALDQRESIEDKMEKFDKNFGPVYQKTKALIESGDSTELLEVLERAMEMVGQLQTLSAGFDIRDRGTWSSHLETNTFTNDEPYHYYRFVYEAARAVKQAVGLYGRHRVLNLLRGNDELLRGLISRDTTINYLSQMDNYFRYLYKNLSADELRALTGDIESNARLATRSISDGWTQFDPRMTSLYEKVFDRRTGMQNEETTRDTTGLRMWSGLVSIEGVETAVRYLELAKPPQHWHDSGIALDRFLGTIETSGLSGQEAQQFIGQAYQILALIPPDIPEGAALYALCRKKIEAFKFKNTLIIVAHQTSQDPEKMEQVYNQEMEGVKEETFSDVVDRFWRDPQGREYYQTLENGQAVERKINLFDESFELYSARLRDDRIRMNMVEQMTKFSIAEPLVNSALDYMKDSDNADFANLPEGWRLRIADDGEFDKYGLEPAWRDRTKWEVELETIRRWLVDEWRRLASEPKNSHEDWFGNNVDKWAEGNMRDSLTKKIVRNWYVEQTLHGTNGELVGRGKAGEIIDKFIADGLFDIAERDRWLDTTSRMTWFDMRRLEMKRRLYKSLKDNGLNVSTGLQSWNERARGRALERRDVDLEDLWDSGVLNAVDLNAFDLAWIFQYSNYNIVRIYGKDSLKSKFDDDFKALVVNESSDIYNALVTDHNWEYLHADFEHRGRAVSDEVNQVIREEFPGRHHWIFGHISMAVRFVQPFLKPEDSDLINRRTVELIEKHKVWIPKDSEWAREFRSFVRNVAVRELFESGAISFASKKFSQVAEGKDLTKFAMVDNADDRARHARFMKADAFQSYLANPEAEKFLELNAKEKLFPSTRNARLFPVMNFFARAHWKAVHNLKYKLFREPDITNKEMENFVEKLVGDGYMLREQGEAFIKENLGMGPGVFGAIPFRIIRSLWEDEKKEGQVTRSKGWLRLLIFLLWTLPFQSLLAFAKGTGEELKKQQS